MAGEIKEQQEKPILAIFCGIFFLGINPPVEKSWQETGGLYSRKRRKIIGMVFSKILSPLVTGKEGLSSGILEFLEMECKHFQH